MKTLNRSMLLPAFMLVACAVLFSNLCLAQETAKSKSDYSIPSDLKPVWTWKNGYSAEESQHYRQAYQPDSGTNADDVGSWSVSRWSEIGPSAIVHRYGPVSELKTEPMPKIAEVVATTALGTMTLREMMNDPRSRFKAIAVFHKGKLVFEEYIGIRDWDNHIWASATKILVGTLAHMMSEEGLIKLENPVTGYLPELQGTAWEGIKVADVLHQRSGLDISESRLGSSPDHPVTLFYAIAGGDPNLPSGTSLLSAVKTAKKQLEPREAFEYASINTHVTSLILQKVAGKPIEDLITERIWSKAGMEGDGVLGLSASGEPMAFGAYAARLRDLGRFGLLFTPSWNAVSKERVISKDYLKKAYVAAKPEIYGKDYMSQRLIKDLGETDLGASYQWDAVFSDGDLYKSGRTGQCLYISPETDTVVVYYSSSYKAEIWVHAYAREIVKTVFRKK
ncbi:MAG: beta-lactamase family protein [Candidatus Thiodiazotropha sp. (ex Monitilora ramsayi)]|nr:beta-lactamase family protein [Candidatus Thiodiazotropha sp. (ex Monitilora ramsayi)]